MATIRKRGGTYQIRVSLGYDKNGNHKEQAMTWRPDEGMSERQIQKELKRQAVMFEEACIHGYKAKAVKFEELAAAIPAAMDALAKDLYERALQNRENRTYSATTMDEVKQITKEHTGFIKTMWCGDLACEEAMKSEAGLSSRCMPFAQEHLSDVCPVCGKPAQKMVVWGVAY